MLFLHTSPECEGAGQALKGRVQCTEHTLLKRFSVHLPHTARCTGAVKDATRSLRAGCSIKLAQASTREMQFTSKTRCRDLLSSPDATHFIGSLPWKKNPHGSPRTPCGHIALSGNIRGSSDKPAQMSG